MARSRSKNKAVCQNQECAFFRKEKSKEIVKRGKNTAGHQRYYCLHCDKYLVETKGTPLYRKKLSERKIKAICKELVEKKGIRAVERTLNVNRNTICKLLHDLSDHAVSMTQHLVKDLDLGVYEADELLTFVKKNLRGLDEKKIHSLDEAKKWLRQSSKETLSSS